MEPGVVLELLKEVLGTGIKMVACHPLKVKPNYRVWDVTLERPDLRLIVKQAGPLAGYTARFEQTAALHQKLRSIRSFTVPEVLAADESYRRWQWRYFIKTFVPGVEWAEVEDAAAGPRRKGFFHHLGEAVAEIHSVPLNGFGELGTAAQVEQPLPFLDALRARACQRIRGQERLDFFLSALNRNAALFSNIHEARLVHDDLHKHNILVSPESDPLRITTILDFEKTWAGDAAIDLARMDLWHIAEPSFWTAYTAVHATDPAYTARSLVYQLMWCLEVAWQTPEHLAVTASVCRSLGIPVIEAFEPFTALSEAA